MRSSIESVFFEHLQVPGTILGARDTAMNKTNIPVFMELTLRRKENVPINSGEGPSEYSVLEGGKCYRGKEAWKG